MVRAPGILRAPIRPGVLDYPDWVFSVSCAGCSRLPWLGWPPFGHESIEHEPLTALEQWKASRHRSLWLVVSNWSVSKRAPPPWLDVLGFMRRAFSATRTGCSRIPKPGVLGLLLSTGGAGRACYPETSILWSTMGPINRDILTAPGPTSGSSEQAPTRDTRSHTSAVDRPPY